MNQAYMDALSMLAIPGLIAVGLFTIWFLLVDRK